MLRNLLQGSKREDKGGMRVAAIDLAPDGDEWGEILNGPVAPRNPVRHPLKWVTATTQELVKEALGTAPNLVCQLCKAKCTTRKRLRRHVQSHYVNSFVSVDTPPNGAR